MVLFDSLSDHPAVITDDCLTAAAASELTGYHIQHIRRLALSGKLEPITSAQKVIQRGNQYPA